MRITRGLWAWEFWIDQIHESGTLLLTPHSVDGFLEFFHHEIRNRLEVLNVLRDHLEVELLMPLRVLNRFGAMTCRWQTSQSPLGSSLRQAHWHSILR